MATIGIVVDDWKLPIFKKKLDDAGYSYTETPGLISETSLLKVEDAEVEKLGVVVKAAERMCKAKRMH